eukprot:gnl/MRDRNA2_/MRDRNA2_113115_c0_seq1.p1 gnl/MRDRNA2_/MRDRNA2_113115_c0~~gnl/MRDRNA2_/MRDRNA2_113115_c0_seq1.p1  ORF type:complete len:438 (-),score=70.57 gnl/MRDRNA2_/MRDRNA2_113115_c0_seq1:22-1335(-)
MAAVPHLIHQTAPHNIGYWHPIWDRCRCSWLSVCSPANGYQHILWDDEALRELVAAHAPWHLNAYTKYEREIDRVDFAICVLMYAYGGVYADMDREALSSPFPLLPHGRVCLVESPHPGSANRLQSSLIASPKGHPFWQHALCEVARRTDGSTKTILRNGHLDAAFQSWGRPEDIYVLPISVFNPPITAIDAFEGRKVVTRHFLTGVWTHGLNRHGMRLHIAAKAGDLKEAKSALQDKADPNAPDLQGLTPLHHAAIRGAVAVSDLLINSKANVNSIGGGRMTPLHFATLSVHNSSVCQLLALGADPSSSRVDHAPLLKELLQTGANMLQKDARRIELLLQDGDAAAKKLWDEAVVQQGNDLYILDKIADPNSHLLGSFSNASTTTPPTPHCQEEPQYSLSEVSVGSSSISMSPPCSTKNGGGHIILLSPSSTKTDT